MASFYRYIVGFSCIVLLNLILGSCSTNSRISEANNTLLDTVKTMDTLDANLMDDYFQPVFLKMETYVYYSNIKTVMLHREGWPLSAPVIDLHSDQRLQLKFDDLDADLKDYYYTVVHCNINWEPSDLFPTDYINGFVENEITDYQFSFNTMNDYTHYNLEFPNDNILLNYSGNYLLKVYLNGNQDSLAITYRFMVVDTKVEIAPTVKQATLINDRNYKQEIDFSIVHEGYEIFDPYGDVSVVITQNNRWDNAKYGLSPTFVRENELVYDFEEENVYVAGNEFRSFDFKSFRYKTERIESYMYDTTGQHVYLKKDDKRSFRRYFSKTDINGRYFIRNEDSNGDAVVDGDYAFVHFSLPFEAPVIDGNLYVVGAFTHWGFNTDNKMTYNYNNKAYELVSQVKQGYYEYMYSYLKDGSGNGDIAFVEGSHYETENEYCIFVYNTSVQNNYHQLISVKNFGSRSR